MKKFVESKYRFPLNLQLFADGEDEGSEDQGTDDEGNKNDDKDKGTEAATFTVEQQAKIDALLAKTIAKERAKRDKDVEAAKTEAEKLATMNAEQKAEYERTKRDDDLAKREGDITRRELRATALETLAEKGLPRQLAGILSYTDADATNASIEAVDKAFREAVEVGVTDRLKGKPPGAGSATGSKPGDFGRQLGEQLGKGNEGLEKAKESYFK